MAWKERIKRLMHREGFRGAFEDAIKQLAQEDEAWREHYAS